MDGKYQSEDDPGIGRAFLINIAVVAGVAILWFISTLIQGFAYSSGSIVLRSVYGFLSIMAVVLIFGGPIILIILNFVLAGVYKKRSQLRLAKAFVILGTIVSILYGACWIAAFSILSQL
ncbi:hypothetical protein KW805_04670 [Candidatus Pacearchaeota archaeon]|nr:hypothetical protein [Candidatus Pacearchaeota archaeon]